MYFKSTRRVTKAGRIASASETKLANAALKDVGTINRSDFSKIALRKLPKALWSLYGLPRKRKDRTLEGQELFKKLLSKQKPKKR